jgi:AcrR family transcriptional regulator
MALLQQPVELDPRVRRTRMLLQEALSALMKEKDFERISICEITERATLSRATFYDHYLDKHSLLECMVAGKFLNLVAKRQIAFTGCEGAVRGLALGVCDFLTEMAPAFGNSEKPLETAIVSVLRAMMSEGLQHHAPSPGLPIELVTSATAWAIYGAAREWVRTPDRMSADEAASAINRLLAPVIASLA